MNRTLVSFLAAAALLVAGTVWITYPHQRKSLGDSSKFRYMHCPECHREKMYSASAIDERCLNCDQAFVPTIESVARTGTGAGRFRPMIALILVELICVMAGVLMLLRKRSEQEEQFLYMTCVACTQRIRYVARQIGQTARCRRCKHDFIYPDAV